MRAKKTGDTRVAQPRKRRKMRLDQEKERESVCVGERKKKTDVEEYWACKRRECVWSEFCSCTAYRKDKQLREFCCFTPCVSSTPGCCTVQYSAPHGTNLHLCWTLVFKNDLLVSVAQWNSWGGPVSDCFGEAKALNTSVWWYLLSMSEGTKRQTLPLLL